MTVLAAGLMVFLGVHLLPASVTLRAAAIARLGEHGYRGVFSLLALAGLVLIVLGMARAPFEAVYSAPAWGRHAAMAVMPVALILLAGASMPSNIKRYARHPMLWGVLLWSAAHLLANGDRAALLLFGSFAVYAVVDMVLANRRGAILSTAVYPPRKDLMVVGGGLIAYGALLFLHPYLFGVSVLR